MALRLACEISERLAGVVSFAGLFGYKNPHLVKDLNCSG